MSLLIFAQLHAADHLNILVYHHVSENTPASTSVSPAKFREHLEFFKDNNFTVVDLNSAMQKLQSGEQLPENSIAITFDDGYRNIYDNAWPMLQEYEYPFTLFVATDAIDQKFGDMLTWNQLREMQKQGVTIANHSSDHDYLIRHRKRDSAWLQRVQSNIENAQNRLEDELGLQPPKWFAYPYGEFSTQLKTLLEDMGYLGFAQHSGGVWSETDFQAIPRFAAAGIYANTKTLHTKLNSHPMPVDESKLADMVTSLSNPILNVQLFNRGDFNKNLNCFIDGDWQDAKWASDLNFSVESSLVLKEGRHRYNCTAKSKTGDHYYWFSKPWLVYDLQNSISK
jgi:peptidoglycan/xylan/chitin deacetylase (PgdA/CDA1 family)